MISTKLISAAIALSLPLAAQAQETIPSPLAAVDPSIAFPDPAQATRKQGAFVRPKNVAMVTEGMTKGQIYALLDVPHFTEGLFGVRRWNYILNFYTGPAREFRSCQFQIHFDRKARVSGRWWHDQECADLFAALLRERDPVVVQAPAQPQLPDQTSNRPSKSYELTFAFNSSVIDGAGETVLRSVTSELAAQPYARVVVVGFTDTVGSTAYNDALGARRAAAVTAALDHSLPAGSRVTANDIYARSGRDLAVATGDEVRETRNRRVRIELYDR